MNYSGCTQRLPPTSKAPNPTATIITESSLRCANARQSHCCHRHPWNVVSDHLNSTSKGAKSPLAHPNAFSVTPPWSYRTSFCSGLETALPCRFQNSEVRACGWCYPPTHLLLLLRCWWVDTRSEERSQPQQGRSSTVPAKNSHQVTSCTKREWRCLPVVCYNPGRSEH